MTIIAPTDPVRFCQNIVDAIKAGKSMSKLEGMANVQKERTLAYMHATGVEYEEINLPCLTVDANGREVIDNHANEQSIEDAAREMRANSAGVEESDAKVPHVNYEDAVAEKNADNMEEAKITTESSDEISDKADKPLIEEDEQGNRKIVSNKSKKNSK